MITINMIIESLDGCKLSKKPGQRQSLQGFEELVLLDDDYSPSSIEGILFCGNAERTLALKRKMPDAWVLCICSPDAKGPGACYAGAAADAVTDTDDGSGTDAGNGSEGDNSFGPSASCTGNSFGPGANCTGRSSEDAAASIAACDHMQERAIICRSSLPYDSICSKLTRLFAAISSWTQAMKQLVLEDGSYQGLLNISEPILKNFISISDSQFRLLAYTHNIEIDDPVTLRILELGYHPEETIEVFRQHGIMRDWEKQTRIETRRAVLTKYPTMDYVYRMQGNYYLHVVMQCNNVEATPAYIDAFRLLVEHIGYCVKQEFSQKYLLTDEPSSFFADLITRRISTDQQLAKRMAITSIPDTGAYRLVGFNFEQQQGASSLLNYYAQHVKDTFPNTFVGTFNQTVLLLDPFANETTDHNSRLLTFLNLHPCILGVSQVFSDIRDFAFAYQEVIAAIEISTSDFPVLARYYEKGGSPINFFEDLFPVYVANEAKTANSLVEYIANTGIVAQIARYDEQHNSNDLYILYWYLKNERKVKPTCDRLFIHRNTLMYRINNMQKRFGFDLDDAHTRMHITLEFLLKTR